MEKNQEPTDNRIRGTVTVMRVPNDTRSAGPRAPFLKFDSYKNLTSNGEVSDDLLNRKVFAVLRLNNHENTLVNVVPFTNDGDNETPFYDISDKELITVVGVLTNNEKGYSIKGSTYPLDSEKTNLKKLRNKRISAIGNFAQYHLENGYYEAFQVVDYTTHRQSFASEIHLDEQESDIELVNRLVEGCQLFILKTMPPVLSMVACGEVNSSGWGDFHLSPYYYFNPPEDGIYEFDFLGTMPHPDDIVSNVVTPCFANFFWSDFPVDMRGVRINAEENTIEMLLVNNQESKSNADIYDSDSEGEPIEIDPDKPPGLLASSRIGTKQHLSPPINFIDAAPPIDVAVNLDFIWTTNRKLTFERLGVKYKGKWVTILTQAIDNDNKEGKNQSFLLGNYPANAELTIIFNVRAFTAVEKFKMIMREGNAGSSKQIFPEDPTQTKALKSGDTLGGDAMQLSYFVEGVFNANI